MIIAIDPGSVESAFVIMREDDYNPMIFDKIGNDDLARLLSCYLSAYKINTCVIEMIASYGMPVGKEVFDTCIYIGRLTQICLDNNVKVEYLPRLKVKINICHSAKANDSTIRAALIDRFGIVGTKKNQGFFYGFARDLWSAFALGTTYLDKQNNYNYTPKYEMRE